MFSRGSVNVDCVDCVGVYTLENSGGQGSEINLFFYFFEKVKDAEHCTYMSKCIYKYIYYYIYIIIYIYNNNISIHSIHSIHNNEKPQKTNEKQW